VFARAPVLRLCFFIYVNSQAEAWSARASRMATDGREREEALLAQLSEGLVQQVK